MSVFEDQKKFMIACGQHVDDVFMGDPNEYPKQAAMYLELVGEELTEHDEAANNADIVGVADGIIDTIVVLIGYGLSLGLPMEALWNEVISSNMSKIDPTTGIVLKRADGKVLKPDTFRPADVRGVLREHGFDV